MGSFPVFDLDQKTNSGYLKEQIQQMRVSDTYQILFFFYYYVGHI